MTTKRTRVLIVEGDADDDSMIASYLDGPGTVDGLELTHASRLSTACHLLDSRAFDAVLLDLALPQTSGLEGFRKLHALRPATPIIVLTGHRDEDLAAEAVRLGAQDYFLKGSPDCLMLKRAIRYAIEKQRLSEAAAGGGAGAVEARDHFLGRISHELRNTLAIMKTATYCLKDDPGEKLTPRQAQMVDMISRNIDRQARIVENILDLARLRADKLKIRLRRADAAEIIADLAAEYRLSPAGRMLQVEVDGRLPNVDCDPDLIAQVLRNLLDNALRHARRKVAVTAARAGEASVAISVTDDGEGIPEDRLAGLFTQFYRLEEPASAGGRKGTGLGLAICREIVEGHHGRIRAENAAGAGARFSFELPVSVVTPASHGSDGAAMASASARRL